MGSRGDLCIPLLSIDHFELSIQRKQVYNCEANDMGDRCAL